jgi:hypothetical protein
VHATSHSIARGAFARASVSCSQRLTAAVQRQARLLAAGAARTLPGVLSKALGLPTNDACRMRRTLAALCVFLALLPGCSAQWSYENYFNSSTTSLAQSQAAATAVLSGLTLRVALLSIVQNVTFFPDNVTYGDGARHCVPPGARVCGD